MRTPEGRPTKYDYEQIRKLYRGGLGYREISEKIGCSHTTIFTALTKDDPIIQKTCIPGPDEINRHRTLITGRNWKVFLNRPD